MAEFNDWKSLENRDPLTRKPYQWDIATCHTATNRDFEGCQPVVLTRHVYTNMDEALRGRFTSYHHMEYRGACWRCDWLGLTRQTENLATEDAHDHAFPQWRTLPRLRGLRYDANAKQIAAYRYQIEHLYPAEIVRRGGPIVTLRESWGGRHVPPDTGYNPLGGYAMAAPTLPPRDPVLTETMSTDPEPVTQVALF